MGSYYRVSRAYLTKASSAYFSPNIESSDWDSGTNLRANRGVHGQISFGGCPDGEAP